MIYLPVKRIIKIIELKDYIIDTLGNTEIVQKELKEICKWN